ncbi:nicotinic acid mononucleotide adenylyltransferase, partial [Candidatus Micrarchaeota archaeon]|nr:nicotinic acid mononucleotide adenylyltransferase [Candidatus Micrarchaeota archaeon]
SKALKEIKKWKNWKELLTEVKLIIIPTSPKVIPKEVEKFNPIKLNKTVSGNISSTMIRKRIKEGKDVSVFLPEKVFEYIKENKLYGFK